MHQGKNQMYASGSYPGASICERVIILVAASLAYPAVLRAADRMAMAERVDNTLAMVALAASFRVPEEDNTPAMVVLVGKDALQISAMALTLVQWSGTKARQSNQK